MAKMRESSTDKDLYNSGDIPDIDTVKKPDWVNLTSLEGARHDTLFDKLLYKPALRFHGLTGGLWGQGLAGSPSVITDSRPPSYNVKDPLAATYMNDNSTTYDQGSLYNTNNISAVSPLTLRRRNTVAVVLVAAALLAAIAAVTGIVLHFIHPKAMVRANVRFTVANRNFTDDMHNASSADFTEMARPLCGEMDIYFLTSELSEFYFGCKVKSLRKDEGSDNVAVHYTLDFLENKLTNNKERIRNIILKKSGRHKTDDTLFLVIDEFWVYLRSLRIDLDVVSMDKRPQRPRIPWRKYLRTPFRCRRSMELDETPGNDIDFITRESNTVDDMISSVSVRSYNHTPSVLLQSSFTNPNLGPRHVLPELNRDVLAMLTNRVFNPASFITTPFAALRVPSNVLSVKFTPVNVLSDVSNRPIMIAKEHTYIPIQPTQTLVIGASTRHREFIDINDLPITNEFNILRQERMQKITPKDDSGYAQNNIMAEYTRSPGQNKPHMHINDIHGQSLSPIQTSFEVTSAMPNLLETESLASFKDITSEKDAKTQTAPQQAKLFLNIFSDVFLIVGNGFDIDEMPIKTSMLKESTIVVRKSSRAAMYSSSLFHQNTAINVQLPSISHQEQSVNLIDNGKETISMVRDSIVVSTTSSLFPQVHTMAFETNQFPENDEMFYLQSAEIKQEIPNKYDTLNNALEMREIVVENPIQKPVPTEDIQWINILTLPQRVTRIKINPLTETSLPNTAEIVNNKNKGSTVLIDDPLSGLFDHDVNFSVNANGEIINHNDNVNNTISHEMPLKPTEDKLYNFTGRLNVKKTNNRRKGILQTTGDQHLLGNLSFVGNKDLGKKTFHFETETLIKAINDFSINKAIENIDSKSSYNTRSKGKHYLFPLIPKAKPVISSKRNQTSVNTQRKATGGKVKQVLAKAQSHLKRYDITKGRSSRRIIRQHSGVFCAEDNMTSDFHTPEVNQKHFPTDSIYSDFPINSNKVYQNSRKRSAYYRSVQKVIPTYYKPSWLSQVLPIGNPRQTDGDFMFPNMYTSVYINPKHQNKWTNLHSPNTMDRNSFLSDFASYSNYYVKSPETVWKGKPRKFTNKRYFKRPHNKYFYPGSSVNIKFMRTFFPNKSYLNMFRGSRVQGGFPKARREQNHLVGFTKFYNVSDIYDMKEALKHLINSMHNMSNKLDTMQDAINFINQSLHESKQPIHKLDQTFENMTKSFDNFNRNLNDIKDILNDFKTFLRPFDNTIFDIGEIIEHIDKTVSNLDKTRTYVGISMKDLSETVNNVTGSLSDLNGSLKHVNMSVFHVNNTAKYTNKTLNSMHKTLKSLDNAIERMNLKIDKVLGGIDGINISLSSINNTVHGSHGRLMGLQKRLKNMNGSVKRITTDIQNLNETYIKINETLESMNEPMMITEGTILQIISKLGSMDGELFNISSHMEVVDDKIVLINDSLDSTVQWMKQMLTALKIFNVTVETSNETIQLNLNNMELIDTVGILLKINSTLHNVGQHIDENNVKIDTIEMTLDGLEDNLKHLDDMLSGINSTFTVLNDTLKEVNSTLLEVRQPLYSMHENMKRINYSFEDLHETFDNINKTLDVANKTLQRVETSKSEISETLRHVRDTLNKTDISVDQFNNSVTNLNRKLSLMNGSLAKLQEDVNNRNETLKVLKDKVNITVSSLNILDETLTGINKTVAKLLEKLKETNEALIRTNNSLEGVNNTLGAIEDAHQEMSDTLNTIYSLFNKTQSSLQEFGGAFPTLTEKVKDTENELRHVHNQITKLQSTLEDNYVKRSDSLEKYDELTLIFDNVLRGVLGANELLLKTHTFSEAVRNNVTGLVQNLASTESNYLKIEKNIKYLDHTFDDIKNNHKRVQDESELLNEALNVADDHLRNLTDKQTDILLLGENYPSLIIPRDEIKSTLDTHIKALNDGKDSLSIWETTLSDVTAVVWDNDGYPLNIHEDFFVVESGIDKVNITIKTLESFLTNASDMLSGFFSSQRNLTDLFNHIESTALNLDEIHSMSEKVEQELFDTEERIKGDTSQLDNLKSMLNEQTLALYQLKNEFGDINGTLDTSNMYGKIDDLIRSKESQIWSLESETRNVSHLFSEAKLKHQYANESFQETPITIDKEGDHFVNDTIKTLQDSESILDTINGKLDVIESSNFNLNSSLQQMEHDIEHLKLFLRTKTTHNNFVQSSRPELEKSFNNINQSFINTSNTFTKLKMFINTLYQKASTIDSKSIGMPNVDMSVEDEKNLLKAIEISLSEFETEIESASEKYTQSKELFEEFRESDNDLDTVKQEYSKYQNSLENYKRLLATVDIETVVITKRLGDILNEFNVTEESIDSFFSYKDRLTEIGNMVDLLHSNVRETSDKVSKSAQKVTEINKTLDSMKEKYSNFSAASFNVTKLYINDAVIELIDIFKNISDDFIVTKEQDKTTTSFFQDTKERLLTHQLSRFNIKRFLDKDIQPKSDDIVAEIEGINSSLNEIKSRLDEMNMKGLHINNTLQIKNERLFVDEQKNLLADTKFPHLEKSINNLNILLDTANNSMGNPFAELERTGIFMKEVYDRIQNMSTVDIPDKKHREDIADIEIRLKNTLQKIEETRTLLENVNNTVWSDDGKRYSHDESVEDIHRRYSGAENDLRAIADNIRGIERNVSFVEGSLNEFSNEINTLNKSLNSFDGLENDIRGINNFLTDLKRQSQATNGKLFHTGDLLNLLKTRLNDTKHRFSTINQTILNDALNPISATLFEKEIEYDGLLINKDDIIASIQQLDLMLQNLNTSKSKTVTNHKQLDDMVQAITTMTEDISPKLISAMDQTERLDGEIPPLENVLKSTNSTLDDSIAHLQRQEKNEFNDDKFEKIPFNKLRKEIQQLKSTNEKLKDLFKNTNDDFIALRKRIHTTDNINIDLGKQAESLVSLNNTIIQNSKILSNLESLHENARPYLQAKDGNSISDSETLEEMQTRYKALNDTLQYIEDTLPNVQVGQGLFDQLVQSSGRMKHIEGKLDDLKTHSNTLKQLKESAINVNSSIKSVQNKINDQIFNSMSFDSDLLTLDSLFAGVNSSRINKTRNNIDNMKRNLDVDLISLKDGTTNDTETFSKISKIIDDGILKHNIGFNSIQHLESFLNDSIDIKKIVADTLSNLNKSLVQTVDKVGNLVNSLANLGGNISVLESLLVQQEKLNYIRDHAPELYDKLIMLEKTLHDVHKNTSAVLAENPLVRGLHDTVTNKVINNDLLSISLENTSSTIKNLQNGLLEKVKYILSLNRSLNDIDKAMFDPDSNYFGNSTILASIMKKYADVSDKLDSVKRSLNDISNYNSKTNFVMNATYEYLTNLYEEINKNEEINNQMLPLDATNVSITNSVDTLNQDLEETETTIKQLKLMVNEVKDKFSNVTDSSLLETTQKVESAIKSLQNTHNDAMADFFEIENMKTKSDMELELLKTILARESSTYDILKKKNIRSNNTVNGLNATFNDLTEKLNIFLNNSAFIKNAANELLRQMNDLEFSYTHAQMNQYVNATFPEILDKIETFENILEQLSKSMKNASDMRENISTQMQSIKSKAWDENLNVLFDDVELFRDKIDGGLHNAFRNHTNLKEDLDNFVRTLNRDFSSSDSLSNIAKRFQQYNTTLNTLFERAIPIHHIMQNIQSASNDAMTQLNEYDKELTRYSNITTELNDLKDSTDKLDKLINKTKFDLNEADVDVNFLQVQMDYIQETYPHVNNSFLANTKEMIQYTISRLTEDLKDAIKYTNVQKVNNSNLKDEIERELFKGIQTIPTQLKFETLNNDTGRMSNDIEKSLTTIEEEITRIADDNLPDINTRISETRNTVTKLIDRYEEEDKRDYILQNLPAILKEFTDINKSLENTNERISEFDSKLVSLNGSVKYVEDKIRDIPNVFVSLQSLRDTTTSGRGNMQNLLSMLENKQEKMNSVQLNKFTPDALQKLPVDEVQQLFSDISRLMNDTKESLEFMTKTLGNTNKSLDDSSQTMEQIKDLLSRYTNVKTNSGVFEDSLNELNSDIQYTGDILENINSNFKNNLTRYHYLQNEFIGINNPEIDGLYKSADNVIKIVDLRLPLVNELYRDKIIPGYDEINYKYKNIKDDINGLITDKATFKTIIQDAESTLFNISDDLKLLVKDEHHYREEGSVLGNQIDKFNTIMDNLEKALKRQSKRELLEKDVPKLKELFSNITDAANMMMSDLFQTKGRADIMNRTFDSLFEVLKTKPSLNISLLNRFDHLDTVKDKIRAMSVELANVNEGLNAHPLHDFDFEAVIQNDSISILDVDGLLDSFKKSLSEFDTIISDVQTGNSDIDLLLTNMKDDASLLRNTLTEFDQRESQLHDFHIDIDNILPKQSSVGTKLKIFNDTVSSLKTILEQTTNQFAAYDPDDSLLKTQLQKHNDKVKELETFFVTAVDTLKTVQDKVDIMNSSLYRTTDSRQVLRGKINAFDDQFPTTRAELADANKTLDNILNEIPILENALIATNDSISNLNDSLTSEDQKSNFIKKTLPVLKLKYEETNNTFSMINKTFDEMESKIRKLEDIVDRVKSQMNEIENINISMSNITSNLTYMEKRLVIMKEHYDNIKEIVSNLQRDLDNSAQFGKNVSLENITDTFSTYNLSIEHVDQVLGKIDMEFTEMDDHFAFMNDTLIDINNDLDQYENQALATKLMDEEILDASKDLRNKDKTLLAMKETVSGLNNTFENLQNIYKDVLNTTADKNSEFRNTLLNASGLIEQLQNVILKNLHEKESAIKSKFNKMNNTLQQNISSSPTLDDVLSEVQVSYDTIVDSLDTFIQNLSDAKNHTGELKSLIQGISNLLDDINSTLHAEQLKHNFINSNLLTFDDKLLVLENQFKTAKDSLADHENKVNEAISIVSKVKNRMLDYPILSFEIDETKVKSVSTDMTDMLDHYSSMKKEFSNMQSDISHFDDSSRNMTELDSRYAEINSTIDRLATDLFDIGSNISKGNRDIRPVVDLADQMNSTLNAFTKAEYDKETIGKTLEKLNVNMTSMNETIERLTDFRDYVEGKVIALKADFEHVNTSKSGELMKEVITLTKEFFDKKEKFGKLKNTAKRNNEDLLLVGDKYKILEGVLNTSVHSLNQFQNITQQSDDRISELQLDVSVSDKKLEAVLKRSNMIENDMVDLDDRIDKLAKLFSEEKRKEEYISDNFKHMDKAFDAIKERIEHSNTTISQSLERIATISDDLSKLSLKLDKFSAINISLDTEKKYIEEERARLKELVELYKNVSDAHRRLNVGDLQKTNKTIDEIKNDYKNFQKTLTQLDDNMKHIDETISDTNVLLGSLNTTIIDINDTVDNYKRMENIISDQTDTSVETNIGLNRTKQAAVELEEQVKYLNQSLNSIGKTFNKITDPSLRNAKENIEHVLQNFNEQLNYLQRENNEMESLNTGIQRRFGSINDTLYSTKKMIAELKKHIHNVNISSSVLDQDLNDMKTKQEAAESTVKNLKPGLDRILQELLNLTTAFENEQQKLNIVTKNKPILEAEYESLEKRFTDMNRRISLTDLELADLRYLIKTTGVRLEKFDNLAITTDPETKIWQDHSSQVNGLSSQFVRLSSKYNLLKDDILQLDYRNSSEEALRNKIKAIRNTLQDIKSTLERKNNTLKTISDENEKIKTVLEDFGKTVTRYEELRSNGKMTKQLMDNTLTAISDGSNALTEVTDMKNLIKTTIKQMETKYQSIRNKDWEQMMSGFKMDISFEESKLKLNKANLGSIKDVMRTSTAVFNNTYKTLTEKRLKRDTANNIITRLGRSVRNANMTFTDTEVQITKVNKALDNVNKTLIGTWNKLTKLNDTLYLEWQKSQYVRNELPKLKDKLVSVNKTFTSNLPSSMNLKNQISYLTVIAEKIEQKMKAYGVQDTDSAVRQWRELIVNLNNTVNDIITRNEESDQTLTELRSLLWSDTPMYTNSETLAEVQARFEEFDKKLESIRSMSHSINLKLNKMDAESRGMALAMENKDLMLTTTTTPASPPDWLSFTSSGSGVIAVDKGWLECSTTDLTKWDVMMISRKSPDGKKEVMAAWKQGVGARKPRTFRDRRIRVKRTLDNNGGGKLRVNINSIQCVDQATYLCSVDSHSMWPLKTEINVMSPSEDSLEPNFPTEVFEDKVANFSCTGRPGYPNGRLIWKIRRQHEAFFKDFDFYSARSKVEDKKCTRTETNTVGYQFDMKWNSTRIRCYIENTDFYGEGVIRILPYSICNNVRDLGKIRHPYTPHKYIVCDRGLNIMQCPGNTCYDQVEENCVQCKESVTGGDPCRGQSLFTYVAHETNCRKYHICMGPTKSTKTCSAGYFAENIPGHCVLSYEQSDCARKKRELLGRK